MFFDGPLREREAESCAAFFRGEEWVEYFVALFQWNSWAGILNAEPSARAVPFDADADGASRWRCVARIENQVEQSGTKQ